MALDGGTIDILRGIKGLAELDDAGLAALASAAALESAPDGTVFYAEDDPSTDVFYLVSGVVTISLRRLDGGMVAEVLALRPGSFFGVLSFLDGARRDITAACRGRCLVLRFRGPLLSGACDADPRVGRAVYALFGRSASRSVRDLTLELRTLLAERG